MKNKAAIPIIGKTYDCFDDGKIKETRRYEVTITEVIPFEEADFELVQKWELESVYRVYRNTTDYFIKFDSTEYEEEPVGYFARATDGGWFGIGSYWNCGRLDIDGSLRRSYE